MSCDYSEAVHQAVKAFINNLDLDNLEGWKIYMKKTDDEINITASPNEQEANIIVDFPEYNGDKVDFAIRLTDLVSSKARRIGQSLGGRKSSNNMTEEQRKERAKKASAIAHDKPRQTIEERRAYQREWMRKKRAASKE